MLRERDPLAVPAGVGTCTRRPCIQSGGQMGQAQGDQQPPRQWDELTTDTGTAGGSWHDCLCAFTVECHGEGGRKEGHQNGNTEKATKLRIRYRMWWGCSHSSSPWPAWEDIKHRRILRRKRSMQKVFSPFLPLQCISNTSNGFIPSNLCYGFSLTRKREKDTFLLEQ